MTRLGDGMGKYWNYAGAIVLSAKISHQLLHLRHMQEGQDRTSPGASAAAHDDPSAETSEEVAPASQSELSESTIGEPEKVAAADGSEASAAAREEDTGVPDCAGVSSPADVELPQERPDGDEGNPHLLHPHSTSRACCNVLVATGPAT